MKIPNYDVEIKTKIDKRLHDFLPEDFRMIISGANTLIHILCKPIAFYDKLFIHTPNKQQEKIQNLVKLMHDISKKVGYNVLEVGDEIKNTNEYTNNDRKIVVFDDLMNAPEKFQDKMSNHYTDGRHHKICPIYITQSYYDVPKKIRLNCSHMILYPPTSKGELDLISKENLIDKKMFDELSPFEFLFLDKIRKSCKKNFDEDLKLSTHKL